MVVDPMDAPVEPVDVDEKGRRGYIRCLLAALVAWLIMWSPFW